MRLPRQYLPMRYFIMDCRRAMTWVERRRGCTDPELMAIYVDFSRYWARLARDNYAKMMRRPGE